MESAITAFERKVLETAFKPDKHGELLVASKLQILLRSPETFNFKTQSCTAGYKVFFHQQSNLPVVIKNFINADFDGIRRFLLGAEEKMIGYNFEGIVDYEFSKLFKENYRLDMYADVFAEYDQFPLEKIERLCRTAEFLRFAFDHYKSPIKFNIMYTKLKPFVHFTELHLTSIESTRKLINRKELEGLPGCLIHKSIGKPSNNHKLTPFMQDIILSLATTSFVRKSAILVKSELDFLIERIGEEKAGALGIYNLSTGKISSFLNGPIGIQRIAEALADPKEFRRKVIGHFDFLRASAPLVKVSVDAYVIQIKYFDEEDDKLREFVVIHFHDDFSDYVLSLSLDDSENGESFLRAFRDYLVFTKGKLPRCIYVDGFTNRILHKYPHIIEFLKRRGVTIEPSSNPNNKSSLERCLLTVQQKQLPKSIHYIGPGIKAKKPLSHPAKQFLIILNSKSNALAKWELARLYKYLIEVGHNRQYHGRDLYTPNSRFDLVDSDEASRIDLDVYLPYLTYHKHEVSVTAGAIRVPLKVVPEIKSEADKMRNRNILNDKYENRTDDFRKQVEGELVDAYIDDENPLQAHVYLKGTQTKVGVMKLRQRAPNNEFDRTDEQKKYVSERNAESARIENKLSQERVASLSRVNDALGFDLHEVTEEARAMKELDQMSTSTNVGLNDLDDEKSFFDHRKTRRKRKHKYDGDDEFIEQLSDTF
jgi:hypothetical protein